MYQIQKTVILLSLLVIWGCIPMPNDSNQAHLQPTSTPPTFHTSTYQFISPPLDTKRNQEERNAYLREFLSQSDMQCQHYLRTPAKPDQQNQIEQNLYMSIFDTVSMLFGIGYITESAKKAITTSSLQAEDNQAAYQNALTPEILKGVEIGRARYAKKLLAQQAKPLNIYTISNVQRDLNNYDKLCSREYGLIEINRALKEVQYQMMQPPQVRKPKIDPVVIKKKVEAVTQEVKKQEELKEEENNLSKE